jgi:hypothetical protein
MRGIRVIFNKVMFLVPFPIFVKETVVNDVKNSRF